ncbi:MAG: hypothetical protein JWP35_3614 [Caulobacter sp.]|nr:hypothetical protein [Caulobacter sp.]
MRAVLIAAAGVLALGGSAWARAAAPAAAPSVAAPKDGAPDGPRDGLRPHGALPSPSGEGRAEGPRVGQVIMRPPSLEGQAPVGAELCIDGRFAV